MDRLSVGPRAHAAAGVFPASWRGLPVCCDPAVRERDRESSGKCVPRLEHARSGVGGHAGKRCVRRATRKAFRRSGELDPRGVRAADQKDAQDFCLRDRCPADIFSFLAPGSDTNIFTFAV